MKKRLLSLLLAACLLLGMGVSALADDAAGDLAPSDETPAPETTEEPLPPAEEAETGPTPAPEATEAPLPPAEEAETEPTPAPETTEEPLPPAEEAETETTPAPETTEEPLPPAEEETDPVPMPEVTEAPTDEPMTVSVNATEIDLYVLDDAYQSYISIPEGYDQTFQLTVTDGAASTFRVIEGNSVTVTAEGLVQPKTTIWYWNGNMGSSVPTGQPGETMTVDYNFGTSVIRVTAGEAVYDVTVNVLDYAIVYAEGVLNAFVANNITSDMTGLQKLTAITKYVAEEYSYDYRYQSYVSMVVFGGGDCWASTNTIVYLCERVGLQAKARDAASDPGAGSGHMNALVRADGKLYIAEAGFAEQKPRYYFVREVSEDILFSYRYLDDGRLYISQYLGNDADVTIPSQIAGHSVDLIGNSAFAYNEALRSITIPESVQGIGAAAFIGCKNLVSVKLPSGIKELGYNCFWECPSLQSIELPDGLEYMGDALFFRSGLTSISIPGTVTYIGDNAFNSCSALESVTLRYNDELYVGALAFGDTPWLENQGGPAYVDGMLVAYTGGMESLSVPVGIKRIAGKLSAYNLRKVVLPASVSSVCQQAFANCSQLTDVVIYNDTCQIAGPVPDGSQQRYALGDPTKVTIHAIPGSTAETYAKDNGYKFVALDKWDVDADGNMDMDDAVVLFKALDAPESLPFALEDQNGDKTFNLKDVTALYMSMHPER